MSAAEELQVTAEGWPPEGWHLEVIAPGTSGELEVLEMDPPQEGIIELAPENPVALHLVPRQVPEEQADWFALKTAAQRVADRRLSDNRGDVHLPHQLVEEDEAPKLSVVKLNEDEQLLSEEQQQVIIRQRKLEHLRRQPYGKGVGARTSAKEAEVADSVLRFHSRHVHPTNKRSY